MLAKKISVADPSGIYVEGTATYAEAEAENEGPRRRDYRLKSRGEQYGTTWRTRCSTVCARHRS